MCHATTRVSQAFLPDKLTDGSTIVVGVLWKRANDVSRGVVPVIGVNRSGITWFL